MRPQDGFAESVRLGLAELVPPVTGTFMKAELDETAADRNIGDTTD
jgi:hypothetical protein